MNSIEPWGACWKPDQDDLVVTDVAAQEEKLLLALHEPPALRKLRVPLRGQRPAIGSGEVAQQDDLLEHFLEVDPREGTHLVPIIGAPGTGKSHLIRWLKGALPDDDRFVVRHIPREGTSLPSVVEIIFEDVEGEEFDQLRQALNAFHGQNAELDPGARLERVATRLVYRIAESLKFGLGVPWRRALDVPDDVRVALADPKVLPALLVDPLISDKLTREGGAVYRLARDIVQGHVQEDGETEELGFREEDLNLTATRGIGPLAAKALMNLRLPGYRRAATNMLSDALDVASADVLGFGSISLNDLLKRFRLLLAEQQKELVLLFEDIAIARGLQLDLIDALTTPGRRPGEPDLCTLRVAVALTTDYWEEQAPETLSTRAHGWHAQMFNMDVPQQEAEDLAPALVGRYLNAARIGIDDLMKRPAPDLAQGVENYCDKCDWRPTCHPTFGTSANGHGLYPLTATAVRRLSSLADPGVRPRLVLSEVIAPTLAQRNALERREFPEADDWERRIADAVRTGQLDELSFEQQEVLGDPNLTDEQRERATTLLRVWIGEPEANEPVLPALGLEISAPPSPDDGPAPPPGPGPEPQPVKPVPAGDANVRTIQSWAGGVVELGAGLSRQLRGAIWKEVSAGVRWEEVGAGRTAVLNLLNINVAAQQQANVAVRLENASGGGTMAARQAAPLLHLVPSPDNARTLLAFYKQYRDEADLDDIARVRGAVAQAESEVRQRLAHEAAAKARLTDAAKLLVLSAAPLAAGVGIDEKPSFEAALLNISVEQVASSDGRSAAWQNLCDAALAQHRSAAQLLREAMTRSQGGQGAATAIDPTAVDTAGLERDPAGLQRKLRDPGLRERHTELETIAGKAVEEERDALSGILERIAGHVGARDRFPLKLIEEEVNEAMEAASRAELLGPRDDVEALKAIELPKATQAAAAVETGWVAVRAAERGVTLDALYRLGAVDVPALLVLRDYLDRADRIIKWSSDAATDAIRQRTGGASSGLGNVVRSAAEGLLEECTRLS